MRFRPLPIALAALALACLAPASAQTAAQPKLPTIPLVIGEKKLTAEIADTPQKRETGMMFREAMGENEAMLFVFPAPSRLAFWMRNTSIPLSLAYINPDGSILQILDLEPKSETPMPSAFDSVLYAIEVPQGWFEKNGILAGDSVQGLPPPSEE